MYIHLSNSHTIQWSSILVEKFPCYERLPSLSKLANLASIETRRRDLYWSVEVDPMERNLRKQWNVFQWRQLCSPFKRFWWILTLSLHIITPHRAEGAAADLDPFTLVPRLQECLYDGLHYTLVNYCIRIWYYTKNPCPYESYVHNK